MMEEPCTDHLGEFSRCDGKAGFVLPEPIYLPILLSVIWWFFILLLAVMGFCTCFMFHQVLSNVQRLLHPDPKPSLPDTKPSLPDPKPSLPDPKLLHPDPNPSHPDPNPPHPDPKPPHPDRNPPHTDVTPQQPHPTPSQLPSRKRVSVFVQVYRHDKQTRRRKVQLSLPVLTKTVRQNNLKNYFETFIEDANDENYEVKIKKKDGTEIPVQLDLKLTDQHLQDDDIILLEHTGYEQSST